MFAVMANVLTWNAIGDRLSEMGRGAKNQLAKKLGIDPSDLSRRLKRGGEPTASQLAIVQAFLDGEPAEAAGEPVSFRPATATVNVPVFGYAAMGGDDYVSLADDRILDVVTVPAGLVRAGSFIVGGVGESMYPRLRSGEQMMVDVDVPPIRYDDVLVELNDGTGLVKEYRGLKDGYVLLFQYNPEKEIKLPLTKVRKMHHAWPWRRR